MLRFPSRLIRILVFLKYVYSRHSNIFPLVAQTSDISKSERIRDYAASFLASLFLLSSHMDDRIFLVIPQNVVVSILRHLNTSRVKAKYSTSSFYSKAFPFPASFIKYIMYDSVLIVLNLEVKFLTYT